MTETDTPRIALVTGASRGLGAAIAQQLAHTHHVVAVGRTTGALEDLDDRIQAAGGQATLAPMDITNADAMAQLCRSIHDRWAKVDIWAHTAIHTPPLAPMAHLDTGDWQKTVDVNVTATGRLIPFLSPLLGETGTVLFFDDPRAGEKFYGAYGASKAAQIAMVRSWQAESAKTGPAVHILSPRPMNTALRARFHPGEDRDALALPADEAARLLAEM